jgi:RNA polymerase sigma-70 factor (ECF subfamily)
MEFSEEKDFLVAQFLHYGKMVLRIAFQNTGNMQEAEDITQDVFLKLMKASDTLSDEEHIKAWLIRVTINQCKDYFRSCRFRNSVAYNEETLSSNYNMDDCFSLEDQQVLEELKKLPSKYRNVIYLYYIEEYSVPEIAKILSENKNTVSSWLRRAKRKLKLNLEGEYEYEKGSLYCSNAKN